MVIGIFAKPSDAESCLTNLTEADFGKSDISVFALNKDIIDALGTFTGSLSTSTLGDLQEKFSSSSFPAETYKIYLDKIKKGYILVGITASGESVETAKEMLNDAHAENIFEQSV